MKTALLAALTLLLATACDVRQEGPPNTGDHLVMCRNACWPYPAIVPIRWSGYESMCSCVYPPLPPATPEGCR